MKYEKNYTYEINYKSDFENRIKYYFEFYGFNFSKENKNNFLISKKSSVFDGWKFNPLNWESIIYIELIDEKEVLINYRNEGNGSFDPSVYPDLFDIFFTNLISFVSKKTEFKDKNQNAIKKAKMKFLAFIPAIIFGSIIGFYLASYFYKLTELKIFGLMLIVICIMTSLKLMNIYIKRKTPYNSA